MNSFKLHKVGFYKPKADAISSMALEPTTSTKLAIARQSGRIELWNVAKNAFMERFICASERFCCIKGVAWGANFRFFAVEFDGLLLEYDWAQLKICNKITVTGGTALCLACHNNGLIVVGTEHGYLNVFNATSDREVMFEKFMDKQEGPIICVQFHVDGDFVVSGGHDCIRVWSLKQGHVMHRITTGRRITNKPNIVWCLTVTKDFTIISGDSRGHVTFWDGNVGAQLESIQAHKADILSVCLSTDEEEVYCAGVDPSIIMFRHVHANDVSPGHWVRSIRRLLHEHEVRALVWVPTLDNEKMIKPPRLYSGGVDSYLNCSFHPPKTVWKYAPIMHHRIVQVAQEARMLMLQYERHVEVWHLGNPGISDDGQIMGKNQLPVKIAVLRKEVSSHIRSLKNGDSTEIENEMWFESIRYSTISSDGKLIFYNTNTSMVLCRLDEVPMGDANGGSSWMLRRVGQLEYPCKFGEATPPVCCCARFVTSKEPKVNDKLFLLMACGSIWLYKLPFDGDQKPTVIIDICLKLKAEAWRSIEQNSNYDEKLSDQKQRKNRNTLAVCDAGTASFLDVSNEGEHLVVADVLGNIGIWQKQESQYILVESFMPYADAAPTALALNPKTATIVVLYADNNLLEFDLKGVLTKFRQMWRLDAAGDAWQSRSLPIRNILFDVHRPNIIILQDDANITVMDKSKVVYTDEHRSKKPKIESSVSIVGENTTDNHLRSYQYGYHIIKQFKHLVHLDWLSDDEMVAVEVKPSSLVAQLPPCFARDTFGTK